MRSVFTFLRDESGGYTIWSLIWFSLYVAMGGLAVDVTDAYRNQTLLQSTADAAALAGVMSLPDQDDVKAQALFYASDNMTPSVNGFVLKESDVIIGNWSFDTRTFTPGTTAPDAVRVITRRADVNSNPLATNFLRILGLWGLPFDRWNISVQAIATKYVPECAKSPNSLIAGNRIDITSNNGFTETCMHAQNIDVDPGPDYAVDLGNNNTFGDDVEVSMSDLDDLNGRPNVCINNSGLCDPGTLVEGDMWPATVKLIDGIITGLNSANPEYVMGALYQTDADTLQIINPTLVTDKDQNFEGPYERYTVYAISCANDNNILNMPGGVQIDSVVIVTNCKIKGGSGVMLSNVIMASSSKGNGNDPLKQNSIDFPSGLQIGSYEAYCNNGGGQVHMYSAASAKVAAGPDVYGLRAVVAGNFQFSANNDVYGISVEAGHNITATANGSFVYCDGGVINAPTASHYRLVL